MPDAMTTLLANLGLSDLEGRLRDEAIDETTFLDLDDEDLKDCLLYTSPSPRDMRRSRMPSSA